MYRHYDEGEVADAEKQRKAIEKSKKETKNFQTRSKIDRNNVRQYSGIKS